ncbi:RluA family pseudouridine synthase [Candidatus Dependentiae bacterium]|nr:RluA family pseudouridine synthase [Candidatus Dependentiae bacterium]
MEKDNNTTSVEKIVTISCDCASEERLDAFLFREFPDFSRSYFQKLVSQGLVEVNGRRVSKSFLVSKGDQIIISFPKPAAFAVEPQYVDFDIVDTQKDFLIINKPAGLTVHHTKEKGYDPTLVHGLLHRFKEFSEFDDNERPGIVHRLDKGTSGLLVVARNIKAQIELARQFRDRLIQKSYLAVVTGHPDQEGKIELPVGRHPVERNKMSHVSYAGKPALTHYKVVQYYKDCSLVSVRIVTGRTHQIRVHFAALGHGLLGDIMYGNESKFIKRPALHSWKLAFDFKGKRYDYWCPVPDDFKRLLHLLRGERVEPAEK